ncbi:MAG TPA: hypothetical protein VF814_01530 [Casimicrobiaceae bacterium]
MIRSLVRAVAWTFAAAAFAVILLAVPASLPSQAASITINAPACSSFTWDGSGTLTCQTSSPGTFGCSIAASVSSPTVSSAETLTANCSNPAGAVTYAWSNASGNVGACPQLSAGASANQMTLAAPGGSTALSCTYNLSANDTATTVTPSKTLSYTAGGGGGGGGGGELSCAGFAGTRTIDFPGNGQTLPATGQYTYDTPPLPFGAQDMVVVRFTVPDDGVQRKVTIGAVEFQDPITPRYGSISSIACDVSAAGAGASWGAFANSPAPSLLFYTPTAPLDAKNRPKGPALGPGTWYFNMATQGCSGTTCNMRITLTVVKP